MYLLQVGQKDNLSFSTLIIDSKMQTNGKGEFPDKTTDAPIKIYFVEEYTGREASLTIAAARNRSATKDKTFFDYYFTDLNGNRTDIVVHADDTGEEPQYLTTRIKLSDNEKKRLFLDTNRSTIKELDPASPYGLTSCPCAREILAKVETNFTIDRFFILRSQFIYFTAMQIAISLEDLDGERGLTWWEKMLIDLTIIAMSSEFTWLVEYLAPEMFAFGADAMAANAYTQLGIDGLDPAVAASMWDQAAFTGSLVDGGIITAEPGPIVYDTLADGEFLFEAQEIAGYQDWYAL